MLSVDTLTASYGRAPVLRGISLHVEPGEVCAILGANGAGKTTLLRAIMGLLPVKPQGRIEGPAGLQLTGMPTFRIARGGVAYVPEGRGILNSLTVLENLQLGEALLRRRDPSARTGMAVDAVLDRFPMLRDKRGIHAGLLSGGQQQMLAIGRALLPGPKVLLLDEPSLGLAPLIRGEIAALLREVADAERVAILAAEQDITLAQRCANRAYVLRQGSIVCELAGSGLHDRNALRRLYLAPGLDAAAPILFGESPSSLASH